MKKKLRLFKRRQLPESTWITSTTGTQSSLQEPWYATAFQAPAIQLPEYSGPCRAPPAAPHYNATYLLGLELSVLVSTLSFTPWSKHCLR